MKLDENKLEKFAAAKFTNVSTLPLDDFYRGQYRCRHGSY